MKAVETITFRTLAKKANLSYKAVAKAVQELGVEVFSMRMKAYGHKGYVNQIKLNDAEKVITKAVEYKEVPKTRVSKLDQLKSNGFEILYETKTQYRLSRNGIVRSVGKSKSLEKILNLFQNKVVEPKEVEAPAEVVEPKEVVVNEEESMDFEKFYGNVEEEPIAYKPKEDEIQAIKSEVEKEFPNTEIKNLKVLEKKDSTHYIVQWEGIEHNSSLGDISVGFPAIDITIQPEEKEEGTLDINKLYELYAKRDAARNLGKVAE